ncbi:MAG: hypothetical protein ABR548_04145 [Actinomycetota bacterium]|nr:hypothetical protein [Actinomycetota bacterium]
MDFGGLEAELRSIPGVVACSVVDGVVSMLIAEDADEERVRALAVPVVAAYGAGELRVLAASRPVFARSRSGRSSRVVAVALVALVLVGIVAILPVARHIAPRRNPPLAFGPSFAPNPTPPSNPSIRLPDAIFPQPRREQAIPLAPVLFESAPHPAGRGVFPPTEPAAPVPAPVLRGRVGSAGGGTNGGAVAPRIGRGSGAGLRFAKGHAKTLPGHGYGSKWRNHSFFRHFFFRWGRR